MVPQRLRLDFVVPPVSRGPRRTLLAVGALALLAAAVQFGVALQEYRGQKHELAAALQRGATPGGDTTRRGHANSAGMQIANTVARDLTAPWAELLRSIEAIQNKDISLQIVEPVAARQSLRITADARSFDAMLDYLQQLRASALQDVVLVSHQVQVQQPGTPIRFLAQARWGGLAAQTPRPTTAAAPPARGVEMARGPR